MEAMRVELSVAEICRKYSISDAQFYKWNKEFLEAGKKRLAGDTTREATSDEVAELRKENHRSKEIVADLVLRYDIVKKTWTFWNNGQVQKVYAFYSIRKAGVDRYGCQIRSWSKPNAS
jgi:transposase